MPYLDNEGVQHLWKQLSLKDYPNNETLVAVINAIDAEKADKTSVVRHDGAQSLSDKAKKQARTNIGAVSTQDFETNMGANNLISGNALRFFVDTSALATNNMISIGDLTLIKHPLPKSHITNATIKDRGLTLEMGSNEKSMTYIGDNNTFPYGYMSAGSNVMASMHIHRCMMWMLSQDDCIPDDYIVSGEDYVALPDGLGFIVYKAPLVILHVPTTTTITISQPGCWMNPTVTAIEIPGVDLQNGVYQAQLYPSSISKVINDTAYAIVSYKEWSKYRTPQLAGMATLLLPWSVLPTNYTEYKWTVSLGGLLTETYDPATNTTFKLSYVTLITPEDIYNQTIMGGLCAQFNLPPGLYISNSIAKIVQNYDATIIQIHDWVFPPLHETKQTPRCITLSNTSNYGDTLEISSYDENTFITNPDTPIRYYAYTNSSGFTPQDFEFIPETGTMVGKVMGITTTFNWTKKEYNGYTALIVDGTTPYCLIGGSADTTYNDGTIKANTIYVGTTWDSDFTTQQAELVSITFPGVEWIPQSPLNIYEAPYYSDSDFITMWEV